MVIALDQHPQLAKVLEVEEIDPSGALEKRFQDAAATLRLE